MQSKNSGSRKSREKSLIHTNGNLLCVVDTESTGLVAGYNELTQIAIIPLDNNLEQMTTKSLLNILIKPDYPDRIDYDGLTQEKLDTIATTGLTREDALDYFMMWFESLNLIEGKLIMPLAHNWPHDKSFLREFFTPELFNMYFHGHYRDTMCCSTFLNDVSDFRSEQTPFTRHGLSNVASKLNVPFLQHGLHDALYDALICAQCYKAIIQKVKFTW